MASGIGRLRGIHNGMIMRCTNSKRKDYFRYGGVGITVCEEWQGKDGCKTFCEWALANGYSDDLSIDRIDGKRGYSPDNCRWATPTEQCRNKSNNHLIEYNGEVKTIKEWADIYGLRKDTLRNRIVKSGWSVEDAITIPVMHGRERLLYRHGR